MGLCLHRSTAISTEIKWFVDREECGIISQPTNDTKQWDEEIKFEKLNAYYILHYKFPLNSVSYVLKTDY